MEDSNLKFKMDWDETKNVFESWWTGDLNRPLIQIISSKTQEKIDLDQWAFLRYHPNPDKALDVIFQQFSQTRYEWEAYPNVWVNLGPGAIAAFLGGDLNWDNRVNTSWFTGNFSLEDLAQAEYDSENKWWKYTRQAYVTAVKRCRGNAMLAFTDLLDAVTVSAQLRGDFPVRLLKDMFVKRSMTKKAISRVHELFFRYFEESCRLIGVEEQGYSTWTQLWSLQRHFTLQCDLIVYLSPRLFRAYVLPLIEEECLYFDRTNWHLDGPSSLTHLDDLLSIEELDCIQWIPGAGNPDSGDDCWVPLYRKIQEKNKKLQIYVQPEKVMYILSKIDPKNVALNVTCSTQNQRGKLIKQLNAEFC